MSKKKPKRVVVGEESYFLIDCVLCGKKIKAGSPNRKYHFDCRKKVKANASKKKIDRRFKENKNKTED